MLLVALDSSAHFVHVIVALIDRHDAGLRSADVVQEPLGDVNRCPERGELRRERPAQVMEGLGVERQDLVELPFGFPGI